MEDHGVDLRNFRDVVLYIETCVLHQLDQLVS